jgi:hypothetical protein
MRAGASAIDERRRMVKMARFNEVQTGGDLVSTRAWRP